MFLLAKAFKYHSQYMILTVWFCYFLVYFQDIKMFFERLYFTVHCSSNQKYLKSHSFPQRDGIDITLDFIMSGFLLAFFLF